jgi:hypothetical protein
MLHIMINLLVTTLSSVGLCLECIDPERLN